MSTLHIERRGAGPPLVLLHGWAMNLRAFDALATELESQFELIAIDLPGHGRSGAALLPSDVHALATQLRPLLPDRTALLGWSLGGLAALALAAQAPQQFSQLIIVASTPCFLRRADWPHGMTAELLDSFAKQLRATPREAVQRFLELQLRGSPRADELLASLQRALDAQGRASDAALSSGLALLRDTDLRAELASIAAPTLVISGQYDRVTPPGAGQALTAALPHASYWELHRTGHAPVLSHPIDLAAKIVKFLETPSNGD